jgi:hypothetical protein
MTAAVEYKTLLQLLPSPPASKPHKHVDCCSPPLLLTLFPTLLLCVLCVCC